LELQRRFVKKKLDRSLDAIAHCEVSDARQRLGNLFSFCHEIGCFISSLGISSDSALEIAKQLPSNETIGADISLVDCAMCVA
jgi:hypothetical protein